MENVSKYSFMEQDRPILKADIVGNKDYPGTHGDIYVYILENGFYMQGDFRGLPNNSIFALHIHDGLVCENAGGKKLLLPDVVSDSTGASSAQVYLDKIDVNTLADHPIMIHLKVDGQEITVACGVLKRVL